MFFPDAVGRNADRFYDKARSICAACPVREDCLEYALAMRITDGVWGGLAPREREVFGRITVLDACDECGTTFEVTVTDRIYCSPTCQARNDARDNPWRKRKPHDHTEHHA